jgi:integrase
MRPRIVSVIKHPDKARPKPWQVYYRDAYDKRKFHFFATRAEADVFAEARRTEIQNFGLKALGLPDSARHEAQQALELLQPYGKTILDAVRFYVGNLDRTAKSCTTEELLESFMWAKEGEKVSPRHLSDLRSRLGRFCKAFQGRTVSSIEASEIADWLRSQAVSAQTQHNHRRVLHNFFNYALLRKFVSENPVKATPAIRVKDTEVEIYTPTEMALLLEHADSLIVPYLALGAFAGLRGAELERLHWQNIEFQTRHIRVGGEIAKTRSKRLIPMSDNLRGWLLPYARPEGKILPVSLQNTFRDLLHRACKMADVKWKRNGLRHSFGTYRLAHTGDAARTSLDMGNSPGVIFKHYRELVTKEQASVYWNIRPVPESKIVPMVEDAAA